MRFLKVSAMTKQEMRKRLASLSFSEKVSILKKLRDRRLAIAASGLRVKPSEPAKSLKSLDRPASLGNHAPDPSPSVVQSLVLSVVIRAIRG
jgi:SOS response regulatory protein OraA/RecX